MSRFYLITVEIEAKGAAAIMPMMLAIDAITRYNEERNHRRHEYPNNDEVNLSLIHPDEELSGDLSNIRVAAYVTMQLLKISAAIKQVCSSLSAMREGCHPFIFYHRVRPFLSGWKQNPTLPQGIIYQGVDQNKRYQFYGGSAAQSSLIPFLDIGLGISHETTRSRDFLHAMREYMVKPHRNFLSYLESVACIREFILDGLERHGIANVNTNATVSGDPVYRALTSLREAYDSCVDGVKNFRTGHITLVADYIMSQQKKDAIASSGGKVGSFLHLQLIRS
jgi:indoleamine 2,3-dioxygenase